MSTEEEMQPEKETEEKEEKQRERIADKLIKIAIEKSYHDSDSRPNAGGLFHTSDSTAYADIEVFGWRETWPIRSRGFRHWLVRIYYETTGMAPNSQALQTALGLCEARTLRWTRARGLHPHRRLQRQGLHRLGE